MYANQLEKITNSYSLQASSKNQDVELDFNTNQTTPVWPIYVDNNSTLIYNIKVRFSPFLGAVLLFFILFCLIFYYYHLDISHSFFKNFDIPHREIYNDLEIWGPMVFHEESFNYTDTYRSWLIWNHLRFLAISPFIFIGLFSNVWDMFLFRIFNDAWIIQYVYTYIMWHDWPYQLEALLGVISTPVLLQGTYKAFFNILYHYYGTIYIPLWWWKMPWFLSDYKWPLYLYYMRPYVFYSFFVMWYKFLYPAPYLTTMVMESFSLIPETPRLAIDKALMFAHWVWLNENSFFLISPKAQEYISDLAFSNYRFNLNYYYKFIIQISKPFPLFNFLRFEWLDLTLIHIPRSHFSNYIYITLYDIKGALMHFYKYIEFTLQFHTILSSKFLYFIYVELIQSKIALGFAIAWKTIVMNLYPWYKSFVDYLHDYVVYLIDERSGSLEWAWGKMSDFFVFSIESKKKTYFYGFWRPWHLAYFVAHFLIAIFTSIAMIVLTIQLIKRDYWLTVLMYRDPTRLYRDYNHPQDLDHDYTNMMDTLPSKSTQSEAITKFRVEIFWWYVIFILYFVYGFYYSEKYFGFLHHLRSGWFDWDQFLAIIIIICYWRFHKFIYKPFESTFKKINLFFNKTFKFSFKTDKSEYNNLMDINFYDKAYPMKQVDKPKRIDPTVSVYPRWWGASHKVYHDYTRAHEYIRMHKPKGSLLIDLDVKSDSVPKLIKLYERDSVEPKYYSYYIR